MTKSTHFEKKSKLVDIVNIFMHFEKMCVGMFEILDTSVYLLTLFNSSHKHQ